MSAYKLPNPSELNESLEMILGEAAAMPQNSKTDKTKSWLIASATYPSQPDWVRHYRWSLLVLQRIWSKKAF